MQISLSAQQSLKGLIGGAQIFALTATWCPHCTDLNVLLAQNNLNTITTTVDEKNPNYNLQDFRDIVTSVYNHKTVPAIFVKGRFVGGFTNFKDQVDAIKSQIKDLPMLDSSLILTKEGRLIGNSNGTLK
ncbi:glutaredoxin 3 [Nematocida sp. AWRm80]|nr:glutaredoxin 3 [Nematocida sp. AWRm80]